MFKQDNGFGDVFAVEVLKNMKKNKPLFSKTAQDIDVDLGLGDEARSRDPFAGKEYDTSMSSPGGVEGPTMEGRGRPAEEFGGIGETLVFPDPGVSDQMADMAVLKAKADRLMADPALMENPALLDVANKAATEQVLTPAEKELLLSASKKMEMSKKGQELPELPTDYVVSRGEWDSLPEDKKAFLRKKYGPPPWEKTEATNVLDAIVAVADYLGKEGLTASEDLADKLMKSVIVEASLKTAEEKCEKCDSEPCECDKVFTSSFKTN